MGGIQELVILRELVSAGYLSVLVTNAPLGGGQTLHSQGLLNSGTGLATGSLRKEIHDVTISYLRRLGVSFYGDALAHGIERFMVRGEVAAATGRIIEVRATTTEQSVSLRAGAVVVAAGCGTKRLLRRVWGIDDPSLNRISYVRSHMICLRGPSRVLPFVGTALSPEFIVVGHATGGRDGSKDPLVTWYVTPARPEVVPVLDVTNMSFHVRKA